MIDEPLNGKITHPLTSHGLRELARIEKSPVPTNGFNPGTVRRFLVGEQPLAETVTLPSPYPRGRDRNISHLQITAAGLAALAAARAKP